MREQKRQIYSEMKDKLNNEDKKQLASFCLLWSIREEKHQGIPHEDLPRFNALITKVQSTYELILACFIEDLWDLNKVNYSNLAKEIKTLTIFIVLGCRKSGTNLKSQDSYQKYFLKKISKVSFADKVIVGDLSFDPMFFVMNKQLLDKKYYENRTKLVKNDLLDLQSIRTKLISADEQRKKTNKNAKSLGSVMKYLKLNILYDIKEIDNLYKEFVRILCLCVEVNNAFDTTMALKMVCLREKINNAFDNESDYAMEEIEKINSTLDDLYNMLNLDCSLNNTKYESLDSFFADEIR
ncbi:hypothetical protein OEZ17_11050 [Enterococcus avium]|uniref:hypothetical protein n=1 Tax=Enterococcus avium TaxID=33945 RepID=UPI0025B1BB18|nr:hypothetical protein [Enterococcus avium]MDN2638043.1 hypothetical protein [Enterococcus avium]